MREQLKKEYQAAYGVNPTYLIFVARAAAETLKDYPWINGEIRSDKIVTRNYVNLGFAVELADGKGLIVPVVKNAEGLNMLGLARETSRLPLAASPIPPPMAAPMSVRMSPNRLSVTTTSNRPGSVTKNMLAASTCW